MTDKIDLKLVIGTRPALVRELLHRALSAERAIHVVGEGDSEDSLDDALRHTRPDVLLFDYEALGPNGEATIYRLRRLHPFTRVLVFATRSGTDTVQSVLHAGAAGLVGKDLSFATLVRAVRTVAAGQLWADRVATANAFENMAGARGTDRGLAPLTRRESDIVAEVARGRRNKEIARHLKISEKTVKSHLNNIFRKLRVGSRTELALVGLNPKA
jgi:DNA-binding NarL/FixJ family response regulator